MLCWDAWSHLEMGPVVRKLILKGFRSLRAASIDFDNPTFLVGRNGSGKSNIADAFSFLAAAMNSPVRDVFDWRGGIGRVLTRRPNRETWGNVGIAVDLDLGEKHNETLRVISANYKGPPDAPFEGARYAFEAQPISNYEFKIVREQCVLTWLDRTKIWFDRKQDHFKTNVRPFIKSTSDIFTNESLSLPLMNPGSFPFYIVVQTLRSMRVYSIEPSTLRDMQEPGGGTSLLTDGRNAASVFEEIERRTPEAITRIQEFLSTIVPHTTAVDTVQHGKKLAIGFTQEWDGGKKLDFEAFNMSDGTLRAFGLLLAVFQVPSPPLIVVEEPEASMHPAAASAILDLLRHASKEMQVVVSTHSPEILDAKWIEDRHLRVVQWQEGATTVSGVSEMSKKALQDHLMGAGELFRSEALEPTALFEEAPEHQLNLFEEVG